MSDVLQEWREREAESLFQRLRQSHGARFNFPLDADKAYFIRADMTLMRDVSNALMFLLETVARPDGVVGGTGTVLDGAINHV